jgi:hypothetical protein
MMKRTRNRVIVLTLGLLGLLMIGFGFTAVSATPNYQLTLTKSTEEYTVKMYDATAWKSTVSNTSSPKQFFHGDANVTGAKSKQTVKGWVDTTFSTYQAMLSLYFSLSEYITWLTFNDSITAAGFNETTINDKYPNEYAVWSGISAEWYFTKGTYPETPNNTVVPIVMMKNPSDYKLILDDCNSIVDEIWNSTLPIPVKSGFLPNVSADQFAWQLVNYGFGVLSPRDTYLETMVTDLGCVDTTASGSTLIFDKTGVTDYSIEITYGSNGILSSFTVKDASDNIIYQITSSNSDWLFYTLIFSFIGGSVVLIVYVIVRKRKIRKST